MDLERIEELLKLLSAHDVSEFRYKDEDMRLQLRLGQPVVHAPVAAATPAPAPVAAPAVSAAAPAAVDDGLVEVESPMVGTFYRSPSPDAAPFVEVGDRIEKGTVLCIIEAMKLMNEIESERAGTIVSIDVGNGQPVQFGQSLFKIRPA